MSLYRRRLDHLSGVLRRLDALAVEGRQNLFVSEVHLEALLKSVRDAVAAADGTADGPALARAITAAERNWQLVRWILDSRRDPEVGQWLQLADLWVADGYQTLARLAGMADATPPLVALEATGAPLVYRRDQHTEVPSLWAPQHRDREDFSARLHVPLVLYPPDQLRSPWFGVTLQHELGHELLARLGPGTMDATRRAIEMLGHPGTWTEELLCDAIAVVLAGTAYSPVLRRVLAENPAMDAASAGYPAARDRLAIVDAIAARRSGGAPGDWTPLAEALLGLRLGSSTLGAAPPPTWEQRPEGVLDGTIEVSWRALPAAASLLVADDSPADHLHFVTTRVLERAQHLAKPDWVRTDAEWELMRNTLSELVPTLRDRDGGKGSPVSLFAKAHTLKFAGATQGRLAGWLDEASRLRDGRWEDIQVVLLSDAGIDSIWPPDVAAAKKRERDQALVDLERTLPRVASRWGVRTAQHAHFFAAYFDAEARWGRIHASWAVPGTDDLRFTPSMDYVWAGEEPPPAYAVFLRGFEVLYAAAEPYDGGGPKGLVAMGRQDAAIEMRGLLFSERGDPDAAMARIVALEAQHPGLVDEVVAQGPETVAGLAFGQTRCGEVDGALERRWKGVHGADERPRSLGDLCMLVERAAKDGKRLRAIGAGRSLSEVSSPVGVISVSFCRLRELLDVKGGDFEQPLKPKKPTALVRCEAGRTAEEVIEGLKARKRMLANHGSGWFQSIVGALATSTHGSGVTLPPLSGLVRAMTVVRADATGKAVVELLQPASNPAYDLAHGTVLTHRDGHPVTVVNDDDVFYASTVGMGCQGLVYDVTLDTVPLGDLVETRTLMSRRAVLADQAALEKAAARGRHVEIQVNPYVDEDHEEGCQYIVRYRPENAPGGLGIRTKRPAVFGVARTPFARWTIGDRVVGALKQPLEKPGKTIATGLRCTSYDDKTAFRKDAPTVLLLNAKYEGVGSEFAVPMSRAYEALQIILAIGDVHREATAKALEGIDRPFTQAFDTLLAVWRNHGPFVSVVSMRFASGEKSLLSLTQGDAPWCIIEVGMFGKRELDVQVLRDGQQGTQLHKLYAAYDEGRKATLVEIARALDPLGVRMHWGQYHEPDLARVRKTWPRFDRWNELRKQRDPLRLFASPWTDAFGFDGPPAADGPAGLVGFAATEVPSRVGDARFILPRGLTIRPVVAGPAGLLASDGVAELLDADAVELEGEAGQTYAIEAQSETPILVRDARGTRWVFPSEAPFEVQLPDPAADGPSGLAFGWNPLKKAQMWVARTLGRIALLGLAEHIDVEPRLLRWSGRAWVEADTSRVKGRVLLFVHGTFSSTVGSFGDLEGWLSRAAKAYDAVLAYDHPTLRQDPAQNADLLSSMLKARLDARVTVDLVGYSRGGLVLESLIARSWQLRGGPKLGRLVFIACPLGGTPLADPDNWQTLASTMANLGMLASGTWGGALLKASAFLARLAGTQALAPSWRSVTPGLSAMHDDGDWQQVHQDVRTRFDAWPATYVVGSNFTQQGLLRPVELGFDVVAFGGAKNDLVVPVRSMLHTVAEPVDALILEGSVMHTGYDRAPAVANQLEMWLLGARGLQTEREV
ncbi:MAG: FAD-binding protein [Alphaproteobacteria bacterium]|nr:FAD-binding protein [Alphaproteobacteria bacterium]